MAYLLDFENEKHEKGYEKINILAEITIKR
jgi:hypothetical protein